MSLQSHLDYPLLGLCGLVLCLLQLHLEARLLLLKCLHLPTWRHTTRVISSRILT